MLTEPGHMNPCGLQSRRPRGELPSEKDDFMTTVADLTTWLEQFAPVSTGRAMGQRGVTLGRSSCPGGTRHDVSDGDARVGRRGD